MLQKIYDNISTFIILVLLPYSNFFHLDYTIGTGITPVHDFSIAWTYIPPVGNFTLPWSL